MQYVDYVVWQWQRLQDGELQRLMDYWKDQLANAPVALHMPAGQPPLWPSGTSRALGKSCECPPGCCRSCTAVSPAKRHAVHDAAGYLGNVAASLLRRRGHPDWHAHRQPQPARGGEADRMLHQLFTRTAPRSRRRSFLHRVTQTGAQEPRSMLSRTASCRSRYFLKSCTSTVISGSRCRLPLAQPRAGRPAG